MEIQAQISNDIRSEFSKLQKELIAQIKTELSTEVSKIKDEVSLKLDANEENMKNLGNSVESTTQDIQDLDIRLAQISKSVNTHLTETNKNLVDNFYQLKNSVTEDLSSFKVEIQQSKSHLENFKSSTESALNTALGEHTQQIYSS